MKKLFWLLVFFFCFAQAAAAFQNEPDGFRGKKWGAPIENDLEYKGKMDLYGGLLLHSRRGDELQMGGANLERISYGFWRNKLYAVFISLSGQSNF